MTRFDPTRTWQPPYGGQFQDLFDHLVGAGKKRRRDGEAERVRRFRLITSSSSCYRRFFNLCGNYITELDERDDTVRVYATREPVPPTIGALTWVTLRKPQ
jgi:hypothetical protein